MDVGANNEEADVTSSLDDFLYLVGCAVNDAMPDAMRVTGMDLDAVYLAARRHMLSSACGMALKAAGVAHPSFTEARGKAIRKVAAMDIERARLFSELDDAGIWHVPLKGSVLGGMYPMRFS
jgi:hypothetical protein